MKRDELHRRMMPVLMGLAVSFAAGSLNVLGAATQEVSREDSSADLVKSLSDALSSFHTATAMLRTAPDQATEAFARARDGFQAVVDAGVENEKLYYNLGNTHMRLRNVGQAIAAYRRAQRLSPGDERLKSNLRFARSLRRDRIEESGERAALRTVFAWHYGLAWRTRVMVALVAYGAFWLFMIVRTVSRRVRLGYLTAACGVVGVAMGISAGLDWPVHGEPTQGVLVADEVVVRKGNGEGYDLQFAEPLHQGLEFTVVQQRGGWIHMELRSGQQGWVRADQAELF